MRKIMDYFFTIGTVIGLSSSNIWADLSKIESSRSPHILSTTENLVAYYPFTGNADDGSGNNLHGTVNGPVLTADRFNNENSAYSFDGVDDVIEVSDNSLLDITEQISLAAWIYPTSQKTQMIIRKGATVTPSPPYGLSLSGTGNIVFDLSPNGQLTQLVKTGYSLNEWSFIVGTYDGTMMKLYVNGNLEETLSVSGSLNENNNVLLLGTRLRLTSDTFEGILDDIRIYNKALSEGEIDDLYNEFQDLGLVAYYPFTGNADDGSGNNLHGTVNGPVLTADRFNNENSAYSFDGVDDVIEVSDNSLLDITEQISLAAWIYPTSQKTQMIIRKGATVTPSPPYGLALSGTGNIVFDLSPNGQLTQLVKTGYSLNEWSFIVGTYDGTMMRLYVNGNLEETLSVSGSLNENNNVLLLGTRLRLTSDTFEGILDDIRIYNKALSEGEIKELYSFNTSISNEEINSITSAYQLNQNFPNPFNPSTTISYVLPKKEQVSLKVYNVFGQEVTTLLDHVMIIPGVQKVIWEGTDKNGDKVASGIYFYLLKTDTYSMTKKMILIR